MDCRECANYRDTCFGTSATSKYEAGGHDEIEGRMGVKLNASVEALCVGCGVIS